MTKAYNILVSYAKALMKLLPNRLTLKNNNNHKIFHHSDDLSVISSLHIALQFAGVKDNDRMLVHTLLSHRLINISGRQQLI